jgi:hypothetical protein
MPDALFIPTEIPWENLKGKDLEELLFWLFDSMGAKDLEWRIGGKSSGTADQGRDLELSFYVASPDGDLQQQRWWVEAKGRKSTVEPSEVKSSVLNASGKTGIDVLVIATNSAFSNPTRDWVKEWQLTHPLPRVKLWERTHLERLCSKNPLAVIRLFGKALSPQGRLAVVTRKLWDYASFSDDPTLLKLWVLRTHLDIDARGLIALVASEVANGSINSRSWGMVVTKETLVSALGDGLLNFLYLVFRANECGVRQTPMIRAMSYLTLVGVNRLGEEAVTRVLSDIWDSMEERDYPDEVRKIILQPIINELFNELRDVCTGDCKRVLTDPVTLTKSEAKNYWARLSAVSSCEEEDKGILVMESNKEPCKIGILPFEGADGCPFVAVDEPADNVAAMLTLFKRVLDARIPSFKG